MAFRDPSRDNSACNGADNRSPHGQNSCRPDRRHRDRGGRLFRLRVLRAAAGRERGRCGLRASCARPAPRRRHGKVSFDLWSRTITVADIAGEFGRAAAGQREDRPVRRDRRQPAGGRDASRPSASTPPMSRSAGTMAMQARPELLLPGAARRGRELCGSGRPAAPARCRLAGRHLPFRARAFRRDQRRLGHGPDRDRRR